MCEPSGPACLARHSARIVHVVELGDGRLWVELLQRVHHFVDAYHVWSDDNHSSRMSARGRVHARRAQGSWLLGAGEPGRKVAGVWALADQGGLRRSAPRVTR